MARVIGLTGGIASGKSTVAAILRELGAPIVDADVLARQIVEPGQPALAEIAAKFGDQVIASDGTLARKQLGAIVFGDPQARKDLEQITHPRIAAAARAAIADYAAAGRDPIVYEAPLLVENKVHTWLDGLIVVSVPLAIQLTRLIEREGIDETAARARIAAQLPLADKVAVADYVIDNAGTVEQTRERVIALWNEIGPEDRADPC